MLLESKRIHGFAIQIHRDTIPRYESRNLNKNTCIFPENKPPSHNTNTIYLDELVREVLGEVAEVPGPNPLRRPPELAGPPGR